MASGNIFWLAFYVLIGHEINSVQTLISCKTHKDCEGKIFGVIPHCCGGTLSIFDITRRSCQRGDCLGHYCETDSDCGDSTYCCRSNRCANRGCAGCTSDSDCSASDSGHVCCKKSFPLEQSVCAKKCHGLNCNNNNDCATEGRECCRDGKCVGGLVSLSCLVKCKANSECHAGEYCCRKKSVYLLQDRCSETCEGEDCDSDKDCGPPNECCIARKCTKNGCSECSVDSDCTYCCRSGKCVDGSVCSKTTIASTSKETFQSEHGHESQESCSKWCVAVIVLAVVVLIAVSASVFWRYKRKRPNNSTQVNQGSFQSQVACNTGLNHPIPHQQGTAFTLQSSTKNYQPANQFPTLSSSIPANYGDGYMIPNIHNPPDRIYENADAVKGIQRQAGSHLYPTYPSDDPPSYPGTD